MISIADRYNQLTDDDTTNSSLSLVGSTLTLTDSAGGTVQGTLTDANTTNTALALSGSTLTLTDSEGGTVQEDLASISGNVTAGDGLTKDGSVIRLGGSVTGTTTITNTGTGTSLSFLSQSTQTGPSYTFAETAGNNQPLMVLNHSGTSGNSANLILTGPSPQIEFVESDQTGAQGKFELQAQGNNFYFNIRNIFNNSFERWIQINGQNTGTVGRVGIGLNNAPSEQLDVDGNFKLSGAFKPGGLPGLTGWTLISQGSSSAPIWKDLTPGVSTANGDYTALETDTFILQTGTLGVVTLPSPSVVGSGKTFTIKQTVSPTTTSVVSAAGTIEGIASHVFTSQYEVINVVSDGTNYWKH